MTDISQPVDIAKEMAAAETTGATEAEVPRETPVEPAVTDAATQQPTEAPEKKMVPLAALHEARSENKELKEAVKRLTESTGKMEDRFQKFLETATRKPDPPAPDPAQDPIGALQHENAQLRKQMESVTGDVQQFKQAGSQQEQISQLTRQVQAAGKEFMSKTPDYGQAYEFVRNVRMQDLTDLGTPAEQIPGILEREEYGLAAAALQGGKSPTEVLYNIAKRYGFKSVAKQEGTSQNASKLETIQKGQEAAKTQSGGKPDGPITLEALSKLDDAEFDRVIADENLWAKAIGKK